LGRIASPSEAVPMTPLFLEVVELLAGRIAERNVIVEIEPDLPSAYGNRLRIFEAVQTLIDNAVKFMGDQASPKITAGTNQIDGRTVFFIKDNGIGIDSENFDKIFQLFERIESQQEGTGVGLAIVKRIFEMHRGSIWVESAGSGMGSCFYFTIPLCQ